MSTRRPRKYLKPRLMEYSSRRLIRLPLRPFPQCFAVDLHIMPSVHRKARMKDNPSDARGVRPLCPHCEQILRELLSLISRRRKATWFRLYNDCRHKWRFPAEADEGRSIHPWMLIEDRLAAYRIHRPVCGVHHVRLPPAEP